MLKYEHGFFFKRTQKNSTVLKHDYLQFNAVNGVHLIRKYVRARAS